MIYDCDGDWGHPCVLSDFSNGGAKLSGVTVSAIPDDFMLRLARGLKPRRCHVMWRSAEELGVRFIDRDTDEPLEARARTRQPVGVV